MLEKFRIRDRVNEVVTAGPSSAVISPDGNWLYMAGYAYRFPYNFDTMHGAMRIALDKDDDAQVFLGRLECREGNAAGFGSSPGEFKNAGSVDCDAQGRLYVSDFMNDRVQVFSKSLT